MLLAPLPWSLSVFPERYSTPGLGSRIPIHIAYRPLPISTRGISLLIGLKA
jgi:hypothetical protein